MRFCVALLALVLGVSTSALANDAVLAEVKAAFEARFPGLQATTVRSTPLSGLYEVQIDKDVIYVDENVDYVVQGSLIDAHTRTDLTAQRLQKLSEVPFTSLPLDLAVKQIKGSGKRQMAVFEDPNCRYCKQLHTNLEEVDDVTVYTFLYPILSQDSVNKARDIWCAGDSATVWSAWMRHDKAPPSAQCDDHPIDQLLALGQQLRVRGTPAMIFADGSRVNGLLSAAELELKLVAASSK